MTLSEKYAIVGVSWEQINDGEITKMATAQMSSKYPDFCQPFFAFVFLLRFFPFLSITIKVDYTLSVVVHIFRNAYFAAPQREKY